MPSGCFVARMPSASSPSTGSGACRYSSSASAAFTRPPARILSVSSRIFSIVKPRGTIVRDEFQLVRVPEEGRQAFDLSSAQRVANIIAQVPAGHRLSRGVVRIVLSRHGGGLLHAGVPRALKRRDVLARH